MATTLKEGDSLWTHNFNILRPHEEAFVYGALITKVGSKYFTLNNRQRVDLVTLYEADHNRPGNRTKYWATKEAAQDHLTRQCAMQRMSGLSRRHDDYKHLTGDALMRIVLVLEGKAGWETLSTYDGPMASKQEIPVRPSKDG